MNADDYRSQFERARRRQAARDRRRLVLRLTGWALLLAGLAVVAWVATTS